LKNKVEGEKNVKGENRSAKWQLRSGSQSGDRAVSDPATLKEQEANGGQKRVREGRDAFEDGVPWEKMNSVKGGPGTGPLQAWEILAYFLLSTEGGDYLINVSS